MRNIFHIILALACILKCGDMTAQETFQSDSTLKNYAAKMLIVGFRGDKVTDDSDVAHYIRDLKVGGVILFDTDLTTGNRNSTRNIKSPEQLRKLTDDIKMMAGYKILISIDQEGGLVNRLKPKYGFSASVSAQQLGKANDHDNTYRHSATIARTLKAAGINLNFAPSVDVNVNPSCPIIGGKQRSFSPDPEIVADNAGWFIDAHHDNGILTAIKHFPGHGSATSDSHLGLTDVTDTWQKKELIPFHRLIEQHKPDMIMTAHIFNANIDSIYPATLSEKTIHGILREQLGYDGVVITDDMYMNAIAEHYTVREAVIRAINAGADMLILGNNSPAGYYPKRPDEVIEIICQAVKDGKISKSRIIEAQRRISKLTERL